MGSTAINSMCIADHFGGGTVDHFIVKQVEKDPFCDTAHPFSPTVINTFDLPFHTTPANNKTLDNPQGDLAGFSTRLDRGYAPGPATCVCLWCM